ncbi:MAG: hypothetical protein MJY87_08775 [Fibrobacter sp.]|nr:hypothetical protein [Fibrobacter sp.]
MTSLDTRRDTKLLNVAWSDQLLKHPWDREAPPLDPVSRPYDSEEANRCWAVGILMMNHYFYRTRHGIDGDLTLDEVLAEVGMHFAAMHNGMHPSLAALRSGGNLLNDYANYDGITYGLEWALNISKPTLVDVKNEASLRQVAFQYIENNMPLYVVQCNGPMDDGGVCRYSTHAMVVDGYAIYDNGKWALHFLNVDNYGSTQWRTFGSDDWKYVFRYYEYEKPDGDVKSSDPLVHIDSDHDGIMDFDEKYRFDSDMKLPDTDFDGVWDKEEIYSYTIREKMISAGTGRITDFYADIDHDSKRAENDSDSDDDKLLDGEEDLNGNGVMDEGETDPYIFNNLTSVQINEMRSNIALYSLNYLRINDGVQCQSTEGVLESNFCDAVSESTDLWAVIVGAKVRWGNIYTKGMATLRSDADVGAIMYYGSDFYPYTPVLQEGALCGKITYLDRWPLPLLNVDPVVGTSNRDLLIRSGEIVSLTLGTNPYRTIKVEAGGELVIVPGEFIAEDLQIESGAKISFSNPGRQTILHVKNKVIWRGKFDPKANIVSIARGFKLYYYGTERFFVEGSWGGTIIAPNAKLILGQTQYKSLYGQFLGNGLSVHQYSRVINVVFNPLSSSAIAYRD